jgi:hypothetical protein
MTGTEPTSLQDNCFASLENSHTQRFPMNKQRNEFRKKPAKASLVGQKRTAEHEIDPMRAQ